VKLRSTNNYTIVGHYYPLTQARSARPSPHTTSPVMASSHHRDVEHTASPRHRLGLCCGSLKLRERVLAEGERERRNLAALNDGFYRTVR
jgi:hypothetical protein